MAINNNYITLSLKKKDKGASLIEAAITIPFLLIIIVGLFELGRVLNIYMILSQTAYEGVRLIAAAPVVERGCYNNFTNLYTLVNPPSSSAEAAHWMAQDRAYRLLNDIYGIDKLELYHYVNNELELGVEISSKYVNNLGQPSTCRNNRETNIVGLRIKAYLQGELIPVIVPITVEAFSSLIQGDNTSIVPPAPLPNGGVRMVDPPAGGTGSQWFS